MVYNGTLRDTKSFALLSYIINVNPFSLFTKLHQVAIQEECDWLIC